MVSPSLKQSAIIKGEEEERFRDSTRNEKVGIHPLVTIQL